MTYNDQLYSTQRVSVVIPVFTPQSSDRREEENTRRMNDFYTELKKAVTLYTENPDFPKNGKYFLRSTVTCEEDRFKINTVMRLRERGATVRKKEMLHVWEDGVIIETDRRESVIPKENAFRARWISARFKRK